MESSFNDYGRKILDRQEQFDQMKALLERLVKYDASKITANGYDEIVNEARTLLNQLNGKQQTNA